MLRWQLIVLTSGMMMGAETTLTAVELENAANQQILDSQETKKLLLDLPDDVLIEGVYPFSNQDDIKQIRPVHSKLNEMFTQNLNFEKEPATSSQIKELSER